ncbi:MAG: hypothetical protein AAGG81_07865 [Chlamydiota bacterium]
MAACEATKQTKENYLEIIYNHIGNYLDKHPTVYKVGLVGCHFFRTLTMFAAMVYLPLPMAVTSAIMVGGSFLYRAAVERFCCFRFTIESLIGAGSLWCVMIGTVNFVSGAALASVGMIFANSIALLPIVGYTVWVIYASNRDIEERMKKLKNLENNPIQQEGGHCPC